MRKVLAGFMLCFTCLLAGCDEKEIVGEILGSKAVIINTNSGLKEVIIVHVKDDAEHGKSTFFIDFDANKKYVKGEKCIIALSTRTDDSQKGMMKIVSARRINSSKAAVIPSSSVDDGTDINVTIEDIQKQLMKEAKEPTTAETASTLDASK